MTEETLKRGDKLSVAICKVSKELKAWEKSTSYKTSEIFLNDGTNYNAVHIDEIMDFDELKNIAVGRLEHKLQILKDEFSKL